MTGKGDINRDQTINNYKAFTSDGFRHVTLMEFATGHCANARDFEMALAALDARPDPDASPASQPAAATRPQPLQEVDADLKAAQMYIDGGLYPQARQRLARILEKYPGTAAAADGRKLLDTIAGK